MINRYLSIYIHTSVLKSLHQLVTRWYTYILCIYGHTLSHKTTLSVSFIMNRDTPRTTLNGAPDTTPPTPRP